MRHPTHGFALPALMGVLALASITTLLAMRQLWINDQLLNAEADQLHTRHRAEAVLPVALADILATANLRHNAGDATQTHAFFPNNLTEYGVLRQRLGASTCNAGICAPHALTARKASDWKAQTATAVTLRAADTPDGDNTAWYWVEVFPQTHTDTFVYPITVLATGVKPSSSLVLQAIWARHSHASPTGQWHSWHVLQD